MWVVGKERRREERREEWMVMELGEGGVGKEREGGECGRGERVEEEGETYAHWMHTTATCFLSLNTTLQSGLCGRERRGRGGRREGGKGDESSRETLQTDILQ